MRVQFNADQKQAFRRAITNHWQWDNYRKTYNLNAASLSVEQMLNAAAVFGINPLEYGTEKSFKPYGQPKPKPHGPDVLQWLIDEKANLFKNGWLTMKESVFFNDIVATAMNKQESRLTEKQYNILKGINENGHARFMSGEKPKENENYFKAFSPSPVESPKIEQTPENTPKQESPMPNTDITSALEILMASLAKNSGISEARVLELISQHGGKPTTLNLNLITKEGPKQKEGVLMHYKTPLLLSAVNAGVNVMLVGPAGSGKTTAAEFVAESLGLQFYFTGAIDSAYKLTGFIDAQGRTVRTAFRDAYEKGGVFLFDELDASMPSAVLAFNAALANGQMDFPDGTVKRHPNFRAIAACNTFGRGADRQYCGRLQLDAASLDRFATISWDYDINLEAAILGVASPDNSEKPVKIEPVTCEKEAKVTVQQWLDIVYSVRKKVESQKIRHVVSPRASFMGSKLLLAGWPWSQVEESVLYKGLDSDTRAKI